MFHITESRKMATKVCGKCGIEKDLGQFGRKPDTKFHDGYFSICKKCHTPRDDTQIQACSMCGYEFKIFELSISRTPACRMCRCLAGNSGVRARLKKYGLTVGELTKMFRGQKFACAICGHEDTNYSLAIDHDHTSGMVRGLLCRRCNTMLGIVHDSEQLLRSAADYLKKYSTRQK